MYFYLSIQYNFSEMLINSNEMSLYISDEDV